MRKKEGKHLLEYIDTLLAKIFDSAALKKNIYIDEPDFIEYISNEIKIGIQVLDLSLLLQIMH